MRTLEVVFLIVGWIDEEGAENRTSTSARRLLGSYTERGYRRELESRARLGD